MGTYVYKISRKGKKVENAPTFDGKIYEAEFAYKSGWDDDKMHSKYVAPTVRAWKKALFNVFFDDSVIDRVRFVMDWEDGAPVYRSNSVSWYDSKEREIVGYLRMDGETGKFRFDDNMRNQRIIDTNTLTNALGEKVNLPRRHLDV